MELNEELIVLGFGDVIHLIDHIEETSPKDNFKRFRVRLKNLYELSYLFAPDYIPLEWGEIEIAAFNWDGKMDCTLIGSEYEFEPMRSSKIDSIKYIEMMGKLPRPSLSSQFAYVGKTLIRLLLNRITRN